MAITIEQQVQLSTHTTMGVSATAQYVARIDSVEALAEALAWAKKNKVSVLVLGGGSNVLLPSHYKGLVLLIELKKKGVILENEHSVELQIGAGENWHELVEWTVEKGWLGLENLALIPGSVGAAPIQNIGAYGVEVEEYITKVQYLHTQTMNLCWIEREECDFGYRNSIFKNELKAKAIITEVQFKLPKKAQLRTEYESLRSYLRQQGIHEPSQQQVFKAVIQVRQSRLPDTQKLGSCGSFFKNPVLPSEQVDRLKTHFPDVKTYPMPDGYIKVAAGWLIDKAVGKGFRKGQVGTYDQQALVIVHHGGANGDQVREFASFIQGEVLDMFGISLEAEVHIISANSDDA
jgi:UDP-N-acetylmuramate dehydrogenase